MVQIIEQQGSLAGRLGKGIAKGLSEQLPKEVQNYRTSSAIEKLRSQGNTDPLQQIQQLIKSGTSTQDIGMLLPYIQQAQGNKALEARAGGTGKQTNGQPTSQLPASPTQGFNKEGYKPEGKGGFASKSQLDNLRNSFTQKPSQQQIDQLANKYIKEGLSYNANDARLKADKEIEQNRASQQQILEKFENDLSKRLKTELEGGGIGDYKDITGEIERKLLDEGILRAGGLGMTPEQASAEMSQIGKDLGRVATQAKTTGSFDAIDKNASEKVSEWKRQKKEYEKYGLGEQFNEIVAASSKLTPMQVAHELNPLENKSINDSLKGKKKSVFVDVEPMKAKELDKIISQIKPNDDLLSLAYEFRERGFDVSQLFNEISKAVDDKKIALTDDQDRQIKSTSGNSFLGDILFRTFR